VKRSYSKASNPLTRKTVRRLIASATQMAPPHGDWSFPPGFVPVPSDPAARLIADTIDRAFFAAHAHRTCYVRRRRLLAFVVSCGGKQYRIPYVAPKDDVLTLLIARDAELRDRFNRDQEGCSSETFVIPPGGGIDGVRSPVKNCPAADARRAGLITIERTCSVSHKLNASASISTLLPM
jgi:hypothetical protein